MWGADQDGRVEEMSRLTDLLQRYADHHQPIDLRVLEAVIRKEKLTGSLTLHYQNGEPKRLEAGKPIQVDVESAPVEPVASSAAQSLTFRPV
jgi:hypothetical protein